ncbi:hypothetical protein O3M35_005871 [Rhynocoris fuscipes]|uniref:Uncharacterized protein n=1 Tax=Rhynocoris fuscipes TaxID=488301 RepID=A0AAW1DKH8_9HEMI
MGLLTWAAVTAVGGVALWIPPLAVPVAHFFGFSSGGIVGGTMAAAAQSYVGYISSSSVIAGLQSAAMLAPTP